MFNAFIMKKWTAFLLNMMIPLITFIIVQIYYGIWWAIVGVFVGFLITILIGFALLKNPFSQILEGKGLLFFDLTSTGVVRSYIIALDSPYIRGKIDGKPIVDTFDRNTILQFAAPESTKSKVVYNLDKSISFTINEADYTRARFAFSHFPLLIYNSQVRSFITKDFLADQEKQIFAEHSVLYLNRIMEELTSLIRDFGRYIVELMKPAQDFMKGKWGWVLVVGAIILIAVLFGPSIINALKGNSGAASSAVKSAASSATNSGMTITTVR
jgi:hypothetical protein